uniref:FAD-binding domain-containing protein n=1 Tax=Aplanochytrium stocchinoi TaxID=215587 RepID=A0A7S3PMA4_9STRA|mmetsp:Transcript_4641/g.5359  ORF Transcript_4641/g.5359 Transcript_4641/m.5359 type:complete len:463 (+) Transcript_4641:182-1570(+)
MHVVIAGAGPAGCVSALILSRVGIKCTIYERATKDKLFSDVGSGYDITPSTVSIFETLGLLNMEPLRSSLQSPDGAYLCSLEGEYIRNEKIFNGKDSFEGYIMQRSSLQKTILEALNNEACFNLVCGYEVVKFAEATETSDLNVTVRNRTDMATTSVTADVLLACDGIHSSVRACMHSETKEDILHFCECITWWGRVDVPANSTLMREFEKTQKQGNSYVIGFGTSSQPGSFMAGAKYSDESKSSRMRIMWALTKEAESQLLNSHLSLGGNKRGESDLTRRGGISGVEVKEAALVALGDKFHLGGEIIRSTSSDNITLAGLYDRDLLDIPWVKGRVALLGDAAHPQSPYMGQGANMAICDAYCVSKRLVHIAAKTLDKASENREIGIALRQYDNADRRKEVNSVIKSARTYGSWSVSGSWWKTWIIHTVIKYVPMSWLLSDFERGDQTNENALRKLENDIKG